MNNPVSFPYAKPVYSALVAFVGALALVVTGDTGLGDVTTAQWVVVAATVLASLAAVFGVEGTELRSGVADTQVDADEVFPPDALDHDDDPLV